MTSIRISAGVKRGIIRRRNGHLVCLLVRGLGRSFRVGRLGSLVSALDCSSSCSACVVFRCGGIFAVFEFIDSLLRLRIDFAELFQERFCGTFSIVVIHLEPIILENFVEASASISWIDSEHFLEKRR